MASRVDLQMLQDTWRTAPSAIPGQAAALLLLMWMVRNWPLPRWQWLLPGLGLLGTWALVGAMQRHFRRFGIPASGFVRWRWSLLCWHMAQGTLWGLLSVVLLGVAGPDWKLALVAGALVYGYSTMLLTVHDWAVAFSGSSPLLLMAAMRLLIDPGPSGRYLAVVMLISLSTCLVVARGISRRLREGALLRNENADLVLQLRDEVNKATQAKARAEIADRQKGEFFASVSHDLRQPLHVMMLLSSALLPHVDAEQGRPLLGKIQTALGSLSTMFERMFDVARIDAQRIDYRAQACELSNLWMRLDAEFAMLCASKNLRWQLCPTSEWVHADVLVLERILRNLLNNAVRYTQAGEVRLRARARGPWIVCQVWDTGAGVARRYRHRIFEDYFQANNEGRLSGEGLGLGLAVVRRLSMLGPTPVTLRSRPGQGSCFSVRVPRLVPTEVAAPRAGGRPPRRRRSAETLRPARASGAAVQRGVVLLIEDEPDVRDGTALLLSQHGWRSAAGSTPDGAVAALLALQAHGLMPEGEMPVAVISDHRLGLSITGLDAIKQLRYEFGDALPAFLLTGEATPDLADQARQAQVHLLHKPVQADRLLGLLDKVLPPGGRHTVDAA